MESENKFVIKDDTSFIGCVNEKLKGAWCSHLKKYNDKYYCFLGENLYHSQKCLRVYLSDKFDLSLSIKNIDESCFINKNGKNQFSMRIN